MTLTKTDVLGYKPLEPLVLLKQPITTDQNFSDMTLIIESIGYI
jgi:hypothetical protein